MSTTPVVTPASPSVNVGAVQVLAASQLFSASDTGGEPILDYQVEDETTGPNAGFWVLDGAVLPNGQITELAAAQLSELIFVTGISAGGPELDTLEVAASDTAGFGPFASFSVVAATSSIVPLPTITAVNALEAPNLDIAASSLFGASALGGLSITAYEVEDMTANSGHWAFNGVVEPAGQLVYATAAQLSELSFHTGYGADTVKVRAAEDGGLWSNFTTFTIAPPSNPVPPAGTMAELVILRGADGAYEFYDIGHNQILLDGPVGQIDPAWQVAGIGGFNGTDTADMLMRNPATGAFVLYDVSNNAVTGNVALGQVGLDWQVAGFGDFSSRAGETDMLMRNSNSGAFEVYDISNNAIRSAAPMGQVGTPWQVAGFGDFSGKANETDMLMRNSATGAFELYDISSNAVTAATGIGQVGLEWQVAGFGDFSGRAGETDMLMRNSTTGVFELYDIRNNAITSSAAIGQVGLEWTISGFGDFSGNANETDMLMRNGHGDFEIFDIANNTFTLATSMGQVGLEWSISGVASSAPAGAPGAQLSNLSVEPAGLAPSASNAQLTQAMAAFAADNGALAASSPLDQAPMPQATVSPLTASTSQIPQA